MMLRIVACLLFAIILPVGLYGQPGNPTATELEPPPFSRELADHLGLTTKRLSVEKLERASAQEIIGSALEPGVNYLQLKDIGEALLGREPAEAMEILGEIVPVFRQRWEMSYFVEPYARAIAATVEGNDASTRIEEILRLLIEENETWMNRKQVWDQIVTLAIQRAAFLGEVAAGEFQNLTPLQARQGDQERVAKIKERSKRDYASSASKWFHEIESPKELSIWEKWDQRDDNYMRESLTARAATKPLSSARHARHQGMTRELADLVGLTNRTLEVERLGRLPAEEIVNRILDKETGHAALRNIGMSLLDRDPSETLLIMSATLPSLRPRWEFSYFSEPYGRALGATSPGGDASEKVEALQTLYKEGLDEWAPHHGEWEKVIICAIQRVAFLEELSPEDLQHFEPPRAKQDDPERLAVLMERARSQYEWIEAKWKREALLWEDDSRWIRAEDVQSVENVHTWLNMRDPDTPLTGPERARVLAYLRAGGMHEADPHRNRILKLLMKPMGDHFNENARVYVRAYFRLSWPTEEKMIPPFFDALVRERALVTTKSRSSWIWKGVMDRDTFFALGLVENLIHAIMAHPEASLQWLAALDMDKLTDVQKDFLLEGFSYGLAIHEGGERIGEARQYLGVRD